MSSSHHPFLVVLSSPSGAGKTSICRGVVRRDPGVAYSVSATTRPRRKGEVHGRSYFFYTERDFVARARRDGFYRPERRPLREQLNAPHWTTRKDLLLAGMVIALGVVFVLGWQFGALFD